MSFYLQVLFFFFFCYVAITVAKTSSYDLLTFPASAWCNIGRVHFWGEDTFKAASTSPNGWMIMRMISSRGYLLLNMCSKPQRQSAIPHTHEGLPIRGDEKFVQHPASFKPEPYSTKVHNLSLDYRSPSIICKQCTVFS